MAQASEMQFLPLNCRYLPDFQEAFEREFAEKGQPKFLSNTMVSLLKDKSAEQVEGFFRCFSNNIEKNIVGVDRDKGVIRYINTVIKIAESPSKITLENTKHSYLELRAQIYQNGKIEYEGIYNIIEFLPLNCQYLKDIQDELRKMYLDNLEKGKLNLNRCNFDILKTKNDEQVRSFFKCFRLSGENTAIIDSFGKYYLPLPSDFHVPPEHEGKPFYYEFRAVMRRIYAENRYTVYFNF